MEGAVTAVAGDCQYVLFSVTAPPQAVITSLSINFFITNRNLFFKKIINVGYLLTQQTAPNRQDPLGRPPKREHTAPGVQIPASPVGAVQLSKVASGLAKLGLSVIGSLLLSPAKGLNVDPDVNLLLKRPALRRLLPRLPNNRPSAWLRSSSALSVRLATIN